MLSSPRFGGSLPNQMLRDRHMGSPILLWELRRAVDSAWIRRLRYVYGGVVVCLFLWHILEAAWVVESLRRMEFVRAPRVHAEQIWYSRCFLALFSGPSARRR